MRPRLLDLFCGAGGAGVGYVRAGFDIVGVDNSPQPHYPYSFVQGDALAFLADHGHEFDVIHASPPCQRYSSCATIPNRSRDSYPDLLGLIRIALNHTMRPWVIENVIGAPMDGIRLCGTMFGLRVYRHRIFESNVALVAPPHHRHQVKIGSGPRLSQRYVGEVSSSFVTVAGHLFSRASGSAAMDIDWMSRSELSQAVPPAYTEFVGRQIIQSISAHGL